MMMMMIMVVMTMTTNDVNSSFTIVFGANQTIDFIFNFICAVSE